MSSKRNENSTSQFASKNCLNETDLSMVCMKKIVRKCMLICFYLSDMFTQGFKTECDSWFLLGCDVLNVFLYL